MYYEVLRAYLDGGQGDRTDAQARIDYGVAGGLLTAEEAAALGERAQARGALVSQAQALRALSQRVAALEAATADPSLPEGVRDWTPPTGAHDAPNAGDRRRYAGVVYESKIDGNTTVPGSDARWWEALS